MFSDMKNDVKSLEKKTVSSLIISQYSLTATAEIKPVPVHHGFRLWVKIGPQNLGSFMPRNGT